MNVFRSLPLLAAGALAAGGFSFAMTSQAKAVTISLSSDPAALVAAILAPGSGINVVAGSEALIGSASQQGTYSDFNQNPATPGKPTLSLTDGAYLTTGTGNFNTETNTVNNITGTTGTGSYAPLVTLAQSKGLSTSQFDANVLSFQFTVDNPSENNGILGSFLFATDEWPTQSVTDILGIFVNGVNFAFFPDGSLVSNQPGNTSFFNSNPVGSSEYGLEWNGLTDAYNFSGLLVNGVNTFALAISDTSDDIFDSSVFLTGLRAGKASGGGGIDPNPQPGAVPLPAAGWLMIAGLGGLGALKRRKTV